MYAVLDKDSHVRYVGEERERAINTFEAYPGSSMEKPESVEDYQELLRLMGEQTCQHPRVISDELGDCGPSADEIDKMISDVVNSLEKKFTGISETMWSTLGSFGFTKDTISEVWTEVRQEATQLVNEIVNEIAAEADGRQTLADIGKKIQKFGNTLAEKYKNRT